ncbi:MAG: aminotransferase class V-fold PLP-dependent enzyme [Myxococcales bacterium]|nr:aminotransferase class V-fold PLP-dependent enzyme [Myxococcales bacterium]
MTGVQNPIDAQLDEIRGEFELLEHWNYLNAADQMIPGRYWLRAARRFYDLVEAGRMEDIPQADLATHPFLMPAWSEAIELSAAFINADPDEVTNSYRPTVMANLIFYNMLEWQAGDNVVITDLSYPGYVYILQDLQRRWGVELRVVRHVAGVVHLEDLEARIDERTKLVVVDRTAAFSGFTFDMAAVCRLAHARGALVLDDAFQALGAVAIDVKADDVDMLMAGAYKWACGPEGAGLFYIKRELIQRIDPRYRNYVWADVPGPIPFGAPGHDNVTSWAYPPVTTANRFSQDAVIGPALFGWIATMKFYRRLGIANVEERVRRLGTHAIEALREVGCTVHTPADPSRRHGLVVYTTGEDDRDRAVFERCAAPGRCRRPIKLSLRAQAGLGNLRIATHFFTREEEIDELVALHREMS